MIWLKLILGGFFAAVGIALFISVCLTPIAPGCVRFYGGMALLLGIPGLLLFIKGLKELAAIVRQQDHGGTTGVTKSRQ
jgi:hypothetical protein